MQHELGLMQVPARYVVVHTQLVDALSARRRLSLP
jgi:hypothetical protein